MCCDVRVYRLDCTILQTRERASELVPGMEKVTADTDMSHDMEHSRNLTVNLNRPRNRKSQILSQIRNNHANY